MLDEECFVPRGSDTQFCAKLCKVHAKNPRFGVIKTDPKSFIVVHFAGSVKYSSASFVEKNRDALSADCIAIMRGSGVDSVNFGKRVLHAADSWSSASA